MPKNQSSSSLETSSLHLLHRAGQCAADIFQAELADVDLTPRQYAILLTIASEEGLSQTDLVQRTGIDRSTLADVVRRMLKKNLIARQRTREDARAYAIKLTDEGAKVLKSVKPAASRVDDRILQSLPADRRDRFLRDLNTIILTLGEMPEVPHKHRETSTA